MIVDFRNYVPPDIFKVFGSKSCQFIDPKLIKIHEFLLQYFGVDVIINNYHKGGVLKERGYRVPNSLTGAPLSQHRFGRAIDITVSGLQSETAWNRIMADSLLFIQIGVTTIEDIKFTARGNWVHLDCRTLDHEITSLNIVLP